MISGALPPDTQPFRRRIRDVLIETFLVAMLNACMEVIHNARIVKK